MSKSEAKILRPEPWLVEHVVNNVRAADVEEVVASHGAHPKFILPLAADHEETRIGVIDGEPVCMFGASRLTLTSPGAAPWLIATDGLFAKKVAFLRRNRAWVQQMLDKYGYLENYVYDRNETAKNWLQWLGFQLDSPVPYGQRMKLFRRFYMGEI